MSQMGSEAWRKNRGSTSYPLLPSQLAKNEGHQLSLLSNEILDCQNLSK